MLNKSKTVDFYVLKVLYSDSAINFAHKSLLICIHSEN